MTAGTVDWYALADDFSGAAEIAGIAVALGVSVEVRTLSGDEMQLAFDPPLAAQASSTTAPHPASVPPSAPSTPTPSPTPRSASPRLLVIDTATRSLSGDEAQRIVGLCARRLAQLGRPWFKKIDSVLRGRVLAEARAVAAAGARVIIAPANPSRGRTIAGGVYFVGGRPLDATLFASDPEHPATTARVVDLLTSRDDGRPLASDIVVGEASTLDDVRRWAESCDARTIPCGAADLFDAWLRHQLSLVATAAAPGSNEPATSSAESKLDEQEAAGAGPQSLLLICGSAAAWQGRRPDDCVKHRLPIVQIAPSTDDAVARVEEDSVVRAVVECLTAGGRTAMAIAPPAAGAPSLAPQISLARLVSAAAEIVRRARPTTILVEGGATASALVRRLGWSRLTAAPPLAPGVTPLIVQHDHQPVLVAKPGSYDWPDVAISLPRDERDCDEQKR